MYFNSLYINWLWQDLKYDFQRKLNPLPPFQFIEDRRLPLESVHHTFLYKLQLILFQKRKFISQIYTKDISISKLFGCTISHKILRLLLSSNTKAKLREGFFSRNVMVFIRLQRNSFIWKELWRNNVLFLLEIIRSQNNM